MAFLGLYLYYGASYGRDTVFGILQHGYQAFISIIGRVMTDLLISGFFNTDFCWWIASDIFYAGPRDALGTSWTPPPLPENLMAETLFTD